MKSDFTGIETWLAGGSQGATIHTGPTSAQPAPGRTVLLQAGAVWSVATIFEVKASAPACNEIVTVVSLQEGTAIPV